MVATDAMCCCGPGACCIGGVCSILSESDCVSGGGNFLGHGTSCAGVDCTVGACCYVTTGAPTCDLRTEADCATIGIVLTGSQFWGLGTTCAEHPCCSCAGFVEFVGLVAYVWSTVTYSVTGGTTCTETLSYDTDCILHQDGDCSPLPCTPLFVSPGHYSCCTGGGTCVDQVFSGLCWHG